MKKLVSGKLIMILLALLALAIAGGSQAKWAV